MPTTTVFDNVIVSNDGGEVVCELAVTATELYELYKADKLVIGNFRPDHDPKFNKKGLQTGFKKTAPRLNDWVDALNHNRAILGNMTWNMDPDVCKFDLDEKKRTLTLFAGAITTPDSATRHRAIISAIEAPLRTVDMETRFSVRVWFVPEKARDDEPEDRLTYPEVFFSYNQVGKPVDASVAKFTYSSNDKQALAKRFVIEHPALGIDNVETRSNTVSASSRKLVAFNTIATAIEETWTTDTDDLDDQLLWLTEYWSRLIKVLPDVGLVPLSRRQALRGSSLVGTSLLVWAYINLADHFYKNDLDLDVLDQLADTATEPGWSGDLFSYENPRWQEVGVLVKSVDKGGKQRLTLRNSHQTHRAAAQVLLSHLGLAVTAGTTA